MLRNHAFTLGPTRPPLRNGHISHLQQQPRAVVAVVVVEVERRRHLVVVHLLVDVEVGGLAAPLDPTVAVAVCEGAHVPTNRSPVIHDRPAHEGVSLRDRQRRFGRRNAPLERAPWRKKRCLLARQPPKKP